MSKLIVLGVLAAIAAAWFARSSRRQHGLRGRMQDAGDRLRDAEQRVEEAIRT